MTTVINQIQSTDEAICRDIESLADHRALLSQNILSQLRNYKINFYIWMNAYPGYFGGFDCAGFDEKGKLVDV